MTNVERPLVEPFQWKSEIRSTKYETNSNVRKRERTKTGELFRIFFCFGHLVIVSNFDIRISDLSLRHWIPRAGRDPGHAAAQARGGKPKAFRETMRKHRFLGIVGTRRLKPATDDSIGKRFQKSPIPAEDEASVKGHGDLLPGRLSPIEHRRRDQNNRGDPDDPGPALPNGWLQGGLISHRGHNGHQDFPSCS